MSAQRGCRWLPWLILAASMFAAGLSHAAETPTVRNAAINMNAGETQIIENLDPSSRPTAIVIENPHALIINDTQPGKIVLVGAETGRWNITVKLTDGETVNYAVTVKSIHDWSNPIKPGTAPAAITDESKPLDAGAGAVAAGRATRVAEASAPPKPLEGPQNIKVASTASSATAAPPQGLTASTPGELSYTSPAAPNMWDDRLKSAPPPMGQAASQAAQGKGAQFRTDPMVGTTTTGYATEGVMTSGGTHYLPDDAVSLLFGTSRIFDFPQRMRRVSVADSSIADVQVINPYQLNLIAHKPGFTTLAVWLGKGQYEERQVRVETGGKQQILLNCIVAELDRGAIENQGTNLSIALSHLGISLVGLPGAVATPFSPQTSIQVYNPASGTLQQISVGATLPPGGSLIPMLLSQNITYGLAAGNSNIQTQSFFEYLETHNLAKVLSEPHLLASSGQAAKFLSGGEIPIVIAQALNTSIVFKEFGTKVNFLPTVIGLNDIELLVSPEVSQPDPANGVQMFGFSIPAFITRRAETVVRMRDNQTLIIAGLILRRKQEVIQKVPYLGDIPYVAGLFRNTSWQDSESDLVISVTPQIVRPLPQGGQVYSPINRGPITPEEIKTEPLSTPDAGRPRF
ncbi:MAG TPA: pilus assembly protein N-terminal domain-containing protein [Candidatus Binataceae bacterium]|nr:pilus assembly protein N-terminal domain-containing protein [Candidatus Binataceae bacterium]